MTERHPSLLYLFAVHEVELQLWKCGSGVTNSRIITVGSVMSSPFSGPGVRGEAFCLSGGKT